MWNSIIKEDMQNISTGIVPWNILNGQTILITGATGMIPSYMIFALLYQNEFVPEFHCTILAQLRSLQKAEKVFGDFLHRRDFHVIQADITEPIELNERIDYIVHGASPASPQLFTETPVDTIRPNILGTNYLLELACVKDVKGFLLLSSGEVYGQIQDGTIITEETMGVVQQLNMRNSYAESKRMAEMLCRAYMEQYGIPTKIARISHTYGPTISFENDRRVFSEFVQNIIANENIVLKSNGEAIRPFCYLADAVEALFLVLLKGEAGQAYNMCNDNCCYTIRNLANILVGLFPERGLKVMQEERTVGDTYTEGSSSQKCFVDNARLRSLGWYPKVDVEVGFRRMIEAIEEKTGNSSQRYY
ncbi:MAG: NAD-dependent epimerase/dehydratase family protein [Butyrivibrio sp.]|nr:NAD-dependent epimerase/dehydratase family protein [Ruminococcus flavefaciens]MCM1560248.1 NAD-dependent epimerase/dehydratase family protein [Butyrivibrio sp.]